jgi:hypothetical protein
LETKYEGPGDLAHAYRIERGKVFRLKDNGPGETGNSNQRSIPPRTYRARMPSRLGTGRVNPQLAAKLGRKVPLL